MKMPRRAALSAAVSLALVAGSAHAVLERVGPIGTLNAQGGYPAWYQDRTGLVLEFCDPKNQAEVDGGYCLLLGPDVPVVPEVFPTSFFDEHFYFAADAGLDTRNGGRATLVLAVEAAFAADVVQGGQMTFSRIRVKLTNVPVTGNYRFIHPYGEEILPGIAGEKIFFTDDVGINCAPGQFDCALGSRLGPFLLPADAPGGPELPAISGPVPGKLYIADPARSGPVTGSTEADFTDSTGAVRNHNIFRIEGPPGSALGVDANGNPVDYIETTAFTLMGRLFQGSIPGRIDVQRAAYARNGSTTQLDVFANAAATAQARVPGQAALPPVTPQLSVYPAACNGVVDEQGDVHPPFTPPNGVPATQMIATGTLQWAQMQPQTPPAKVCVVDNSARNALGQIAPTYAPFAVSDTVVVTDAYYDPGQKTLAVTATSSDTVSPPSFTLSFKDFLSSMQNGQVVVSNVNTPPARVQVTSSAGGLGDFPVRMGLAPVVAQVGPVAVNDTFTINEDAGPQTLAVLGNDSNAGNATVAIASAPRLGTAVVSADGRNVIYTPNPNANGTDGFSYTATVNGMASNPANVTVTITPVNDAPVAVNEAANALTNVPTQIDVAANDIDVDGNADIVGVTNLTQPVGDAGQLGATVTAVGRIVTFTATAEGTYTFTYRAQDTAGVSSANDATVTVTVIAAEAVNITKSDYQRSKSRLRVDGDISPASNQTLDVVFTDNAGVQKGDRIDRVTSDGAGIWTIDKIIALPSGATRIKATSQNGTSQSRALRLN